MDISDHPVTVKALCCLQTWDIQTLTGLSIINPSSATSTRGDNFPVARQLPHSMMWSFSCKTFSQLNVQQCMQWELRGSLHQNTPLASSGLSPVWDFWTSLSNGTLERVCNSSHDVMWVQRGFCKGNVVVEEGGNKKTFKVKAVFMC